MSQFFENLKGMSKSKGILLTMIAIIAGIFAWSYFRTPPEASNRSTVGSTPMNQQTVQGTDRPQNPEYIAQLNQADQKRAEEAKQTGTSAVPTVLGETQGQEEPALDLTPKIEGANGVTPPEAEIAQQPIVMEQPVTATVPIVNAPSAPVATVTPQMVDGMFDAMTRRVPPVAAVVDFGATLPEPVVASADESTDAETVDASTDSKVTIPLPGTILYAELIGRANSDHPGPVLARVLQGEYTGATLIGSFSVAQNALVIKFDRMTVTKTRSGEEINETVDINGAAVDTKYIGTGLATSVNRHMFQKLAIAFTTGFATGFGDAISQTGETTIDTGNGTITTGGTDLNAKEELLSAGGQAVSNAGSMLQQEFGNRPTTVIVEQGTPIGVLFL